MAFCKADTRTLTKIRQDNLKKNLFVELVSNLLAPVKYNVNLFYEDFFLNIL